MTPWKILIVDDEEGIHGITRMIFRDYEFEQRPIELISAMSSAEAKTQLTQHPDIALILLDVVMETENAGLQLVEHIRHQQSNSDVRIILRTGHPGYAPEAQVIIDYDINDYLSKAELSASRLLTSVIVALRSYRDIQNARDLAEHSAGEAAHTASLPPTEETEQATLLTDVVSALQNQVKPALKQSQRLSKLELNPVASELAKDLHAHQVRLNRNLQICLHEQLPPAKAESLSLSELLDSLLHLYLPQSRQEGWILDYRLQPDTPQVIQTDKGRLELLLTTAVELALLQAQKSDLKVTLSTESPTAGQPDTRLVIQVEQSEGQPVFEHSPRSHQLREGLNRICAQLEGRFTEIDEGGQLCCRIPLQGL